MALHLEQAVAPVGRLGDDVDVGVASLTTGFCGMGASTIRTRVSRTVIDVNRDPSGGSLYPGRATTGLSPLTTFDGEPLYPFGHGLSYTTFAIGDLRLSARTISPAGQLRVTASVRNAGRRAGDEVVQLYIRDVASTVTRPVRELKGFTRVSLAPGETRQVEFVLTAAELGFYDRDLTYVVEPGDLEVFVGTSADDVVPAGTVVVVPGEAGAPAKMYDGDVTVEHAREGLDALTFTMSGGLVVGDVVAMTL